MKDYLLARASVIGSASVPEYVFRRVDAWQTKETEFGSAFLGEPGTWIHPPAGSKHTSLLALLCCPGCHEIRALDSRIHEINHLGHIEVPGSRGFVCDGRSERERRCFFTRDAYLDEWLKRKPLYCIVTVRHQVFEKHYMHAATSTEARQHLGPGDYDIVAVGRAIGFFVEDTKGMILSA